MANKTAPEEKPIIDMEALRDCLLSLRDSVYCPECRMPNWAYHDNVRHFPDCKLGKFIDILCRLYPKENTKVKWIS